MKSIPQLVGEPLEQFSGNFRNKSLIIAENPESEVSSEHKISHEPLESIFTMIGRIIISNTDPTNNNLSDDDGNDYPLGTRWINNSNPDEIKEFVLGSNNVSAVWKQLILEDQVGVAGGVVPLDENGRIDPKFLTIEAFSFKGKWDAELNAPELVDGTGNVGDLYIVSVPGVKDLGSGEIEFKKNDRVIYDGHVWFSIKSGNLLSINGKVPDDSGNITLDAKDIKLRDKDSNVEDELSLRYEYDDVIKSEKELKYSRESDDKLFLGYINGKIFLKDFGTKNLYIIDDETKERTEFKFDYDIIKIEFINGYYFTINPLGFIIFDEDFNLVKKIDFDTGLTYKYGYRYKFLLFKYVIFNNKIYIKLSFDLDHPHNNDGWFIILNEDFSIYYSQELYYSTYLNDDFAPKSFDFKILNNNFVIFDYNSILVTSDGENASVINSNGTTGQIAQDLFNIVNTYDRDIITIVNDKISFIDFNEIGENKIYLKEFDPENSAIINKNFINSSNDTHTSNSIIKNGTDILVKISQSGTVDFFYANDNEIIKVNPIDDFYFYDSYCPFIKRFIRNNDFIYILDSYDKPKMYKISLTNESSELINIPEIYSDLPILGFLNFENKICLLIGNNVVELNNFNLINENIIIPHYDCIEVFDNKILAPNFLLEYYEDHSLFFGDSNFIYTDYNTSYPILKDFTYNILISSRFISNLNGVNFYFDPSENLKPLHIKDNLYVIMNCLVDFDNLNESKVLFNTEDPFISSIRIIKDLILGDYLPIFYFKDQDFDSNGNCYDPQNSNTYINYEDAKYNEEDFVLAGDEHDSPGIGFKNCIILNLRTKEIFNVEKPILAFFKGEGSFYYITRENFYDIYPADRIPSPRFNNFLNKIIINSNNELEVISRIRIIKFYSYGINSAGVVSSSSIFYLNNKFYNIRTFFEPNPNAESTGNEPSNMFNSIKTLVLVDNGGNPLEYDIDHENQLTREQIFNEDPSICLTFKPIKSVSLDNTCFGYLSYRSSNDEYINFYNLLLEKDDFSIIIFDHLNYETKINPVDDFDFFYNEEYGIKEFIHCKKIFINKNVLIKKFESTDNKIFDTAMKDSVNGSYTFDDCFNPAFIYANLKGEFNNKIVNNTLILLNKAEDLNLINSNLYLSKNIFNCNFKTTQEAFNGYIFNLKLRIQKCSKLFFNNIERCYFQDNIGIFYNEFLNTNINSCYVDLDQQYSTIEDTADGGWNKKVNE